VRDEPAAPLPPTLFLVSIEFKGLVETVSVSMESKGLSEKRPTVRDAYDSSYGQELVMRLTS
jgi:hypothetical protein